MKKILFLICIFFAALQANAQSMLRVTTTDHIMIQVSVDNRYYNKHSKSLMIGDLPPGKHFIQVFAYSGEQRGRRFRNMIFEGKVKTHTNEVTTCVVDANTGNINTYTDKADMQSNAPNNTDDVYFGPKRKITPVDTTPNIPADNASAIGDDEVTKLGKKVSDKLTDTDKMKKMKSTLKGKAVTTAQVSTMMGWLNFETTRLEFAEWIYPNTTDKDHYMELENKFTFSSTKQKLEEYISTKK